MRTRKFATGSGGFFEKLQFRSALVLEPVFYVRPAWRCLLSLRDPAGASHTAGPPDCNACKLET
jgi:hypothetical protein